MLTARTSIRSCKRARFYRTFMAGETHLVLKGFDAVVYPSEEEGDNFEVILFEEGNEIYQITIPIPVDEDSDQAYSEDLIEYAAQAAIDLYEATRGTLGQGAGATMKEGQNKPGKQACCSMEWEDWYIQLKGTPYEEQATQLLEQLIEARHPPQAQDMGHSELWDEEEAILRELDMLNLERLKKAPANQTVIVINARKKAYLYGASDIQEYLEKFSGCGDLEIRAIAKMQELLDVRAKIRNMDDSDAGRWEQIADLEAAMEELLLQHIQQGALEAAPVEGMDANPAMAADLAELMQGVDLNSPVEPMIARKAQIREPGGLGMYDYGISAEEVLEFFKKWHYSEFEEAPEDDVIDAAAKIIEEDVVLWSQVSMRKLFDRIKDELGYEIHPYYREASKKAQEEDKDDSEEERELIELGEQHEGLDPAEIPLDDQKYEIGDKVTFSGEFEDVGAGGVISTIPSGTSAIVDSLWDGHGDMLLVVLESGRVVRAPVSALK